MNKLIGILGGSFDPIHNGHLALASYLIQKLHFHRVHFLPCGQHAFNKPIQASNEQRLDMLRLAISDTPQFQLDQREIERNEVSYSINSLKELNKEKDKSSSLVFILGMDAFLSLPDWQEWQHLTDYAHLVIVKRELDADYSREVALFVKQHQTSEIKDLGKTLAGKLYFPQFTLIPISSTLIRDTISSGKSIDEYVPRAVAEYILYNGVYGSTL